MMMGLQDINWADRSVVKFISGRPVIVASFKLCDLAISRLYSLEKLTGFVLISKLSVDSTIYVYIYLFFPSMYGPDVLEYIYLPVLPFRVRARFT